MKSLSSFIIVLSVCCGLLTQTAQAENEYGDPKHRATFKVESAELCPGQETEIGIYVDLMLGQPGGGSGTYEEGQLPPDPLENFMFYIYVSDTSLAEVVCSSVEDRGNGYKVGYPVLSELMPELSGGTLTCAYIVGSNEGNLGKRGRFTCIWTRSRAATELIPDQHAPLFKIRIRSKEAATVTIGIDDPNEIAFSTGLAQTGGYYYSFTNIDGKIPNRVPGVLKPAPGPDKALVSAGPDSSICINTRVTFNAEGGLSYRWSQVYNPSIGGYQNEYLSNRNTKNPTFLPLRAGIFVYQVEAFNELGCSTRDTVIYQVHQNYLGSKLLSISPSDVMVDSGSRVSFTLKGSNGLSTAKMSVVLTPDSLFEPGGNVLRPNTASLNGTLISKPVYDPELITATFSDGVCQDEIPAIIRISGVDVSGKIAQFPVYRCGNDRAVKSLQLNLATRGGSGKFLYNWRATDLEFTDFPLAAPKIDNAASATPKLTYYGRCAISVDIYDMVSGKTVTISDTMIYRDWLQASTTVSIDTAAFMAAGMDLDGPYCEGTVHTYKANSVHAGKDARYIWHVNGVWKDEGINMDTYTDALHKGDSVSCVLYSTESCVANMAVESQAFALDIRYPVIPQIELVNNDPYNYECENVAIKAIFHSMGKSFRMQWLRNGEFEKEETVNAEDPDFYETVVRFPRQSFYDGFSCRVVESDMPCNGFDTVYFNNENRTNEIYPLFDNDGNATNAEPYAVAVQMPEEAVCETSPFTLTAEVKNMPPKFTVAWYKKEGESSVLLGFYGQLQTALDPNYRLNTDYGYGNRTGAPQEYIDLAEVAKDGFKIILNDPDARHDVRKTFNPGDTVFFELTASYRNSCSVGNGRNIVSRSPYFVPALVKPSATPAELSIEFVEKTKLCPSIDHVYHLAASLTGEEYYKLDWTFEDFSVTDNSEENGNIAQYFKLLGSRGDTLESRLTIRPSTGVTGFQFGTWGGCTATVTRGCNAGAQYTATFNLNDSVWDKPFFRLHHSADTIVCANQPVEHSVRIEEMNQDHTMGGQGSETNYTVKWYVSLRDMQQERNGTEGLSFLHTPTPNANQPRGTGDYEDNRGVFGYYIHAQEKTSGCEVVDSVFVMVGHPYEVKASIDLLHPGAWCDSSDYISPDPSRKVEGSAYLPGGQYALLRISNGGASPKIEWGLDDEVYSNLPYDTLNLSGVPSGSTLKAWVKTSMYTCLPDKAETEPVVLQTSVMGDVYGNAPKKAAEGEEILLQAYVGKHGKASMGLEGYTFTYSMEQPDGSWLSVGDGSSKTSGYWLDSIVATMPGRAGRFRAESHDKYGVCPVRYANIDVSLVVNTGITMKVFDPVTGSEITGLCPQSYELVYADRQNAPVGKAVVWVNDTRKPIDVLVRTYPQNPGKDAYVGYWKNGILRAMGPVGSSMTLGFNPQEEDPTCILLEKGDTITAHIMPGDRFGAYYVHDTMSVDGQFISYSEQITMDIAATDRLVIEASATAVCSGGEVNLHADFVNNEITWLPQEDYKSQAGASAIAVVSQTSVFTATGVASNGCSVKDSILINTISDNEKLPLAIKCDSLEFCGEEAELLIEIDQTVSHAQDFTRFDWYAVEEGGNRLIGTTTEAALLGKVSDGMRIMAQAQSALSCQKGLSQSDTLVFAGFEYPHLNRLLPVSGDTSVCPGSEVALVYNVEPQEAVREWQVFVSGYSDVLTDKTDSLLFVATESTGFVILARNPDKLECAAADTVAVFVKQNENYRLAVSLEADKEAVCGAEEVTYTASTNGDYVYWFANGELLENNDLSLVRVPRFTGVDGNADSVYAMAVNAGDECTPADSLLSAPVLVWRVEKPELSLLCADTTVYKNHPVSLQAKATAFDGSAPLISWHQADGEPFAIDSNLSRYTLKNETPGEFIYYALAFQVEVVETLLYCHSVDSVRVKVEEDMAVEDLDGLTLNVNPNPTSGKFRLQLSVPARVEIFSVTGTRVWFAERVEGTEEIELHASGIYFIRAEVPGGTVMRKLVVR